MIFCIGVNTQIKTMRDFEEARQSKTLLSFKLIINLEIDSLLDYIDKDDYIEKATKYFEDNNWPIKHIDVISLCTSSNKYPRVSLITYPMYLNDYANFYTSNINPDIKELVSNYIFIDNIYND